MPSRLDVLFFFPCGKFLLANAPVAYIAYPVISDRQPSMEEKATEKPELEHQESNGQDIKAAATEQHLWRDQIPYGKTGTLANLPDA